MSLSGFATGDARRGMARAPPTVYERLIDNPQRFARETGLDLTLTELTREQLREYDVQRALRVYVMTRLGEAYEITPVYSTAYGNEWTQRLLDLTDDGQLMGRIDRRIANMPLKARLAALSGFLHYAKSALPEGQGMYPEDFAAELEHAEQQEDDKRRRIAGINDLLQTL